MYNKLRELARGTGHAGVKGEDLARAIPAALETNIREALAALEEDNKLMVDGPNVGLEGVTAYEIVTGEVVPQGTKGEGAGGQGVRARF